MEDRMMAFFAEREDGDPRNGFCALAESVCEALPASPERTVLLRKLLEAQDAYDRALTLKRPGNFISAVGAWPGDETDEELSEVLKAK